MRNTYPVEGFTVTTEPVLRRPVTDRVVVWCATVNPPDMDEPIKGYGATEPEAIAAVFNKLS